MVRAAVQNDPRVREEEPVGRPQLSERSHYVINA